MAIANSKLNRLVLSPASVKAFILPIPECLLALALMNAAQNLATSPYNWEQERP